MTDAQQASDKCFSEGRGRDRGSIPSTEAGCQKSLCGFTWNVWLLSVSGVVGFLLEGGTQSSSGWGGKLVPCGPV